MITHIYLTVHGYLLGEVSSVRWTNEGAVEIVCTGMPEPSAEEFALVGAEVEVGAQELTMGDRIAVEGRLVSLTHRSERTTICLDRLSNIRDGGLLANLIAPPAHIAAV